MMDNSIIFPFLMHCSLACPADVKARVHSFQPLRAERWRSVKTSGQRMRGAECGAHNGCHSALRRRPACVHKRLQTAGDQLTQNTRGDPADACQRGSVLPGAWQPSRAPALLLARELTPRVRIALGCGALSGRGGPVASIPSRATAASSSPLACSGCQLCVPAAPGTAGAALQPAARRAGNTVYSLAGSHKAGLASPTPPPSARVLNFSVGP